MTIDEPIELSEAGDLLGKFEERYKNLSYLKNALQNISEITEGNFPENCKTAARKMLDTYRSRFLETMRLVISDPYSFPLEDIIHWNQGAQVFLEAGFDDGQEYNNAAKSLMITCIACRLTESHDLSPSDRKRLGKQLIELFRPPGGIGGGSN